MNPRAKVALEKQSHAERFCISRAVIGARRSRTIELATASVAVIARVIGEWSDHE
jgi:hypothetical protein